MLTYRTAYGEGQVGEDGGQYEEGVRYHERSHVTHQCFSVEVSQFWNDCIHEESDEEKRDGDYHADIVRFLPYFVFGRRKIRHTYYSADFLERLFPVETSSG